MFEPETQMCFSDIYGIHHQSNTTPTDPGPDPTWLCKAFARKAPEGGEHGPFETQKLEDWNCLPFAVGGWGFYVLVAL